MKRETRTLLPPDLRDWVEMLELASELKLLKLGTVSIDGTHLRASGSEDKNLTNEGAQQLRANSASRSAPSCKGRTDRPAGGGSTKAARGDRAARKAPA